jgi:hypothetical protein
VRYENGHLVFDWKTGGQHVMFEDTQVNGKKTSDTFPEPAAEAFIAAVHARQKELGFIP